MSLPDWLEALLPGETAATWQAVAPAVPAEAYLGGGSALAVHLRHRPSRDLVFVFHGEVDLDGLVERVRARGPFAVTRRAPGTLNRLFGETRLQFLQAGLVRPERRLEPTTAPRRRAGGGARRPAGDEARRGRGPRGAARLPRPDAIERQGGRTIEEGLGLFLARYQSEHEDSAITPILLTLGHLDDVGGDPFLPVERDLVVRYWQRRQPELVAIERYGISRPSPLEPSEDDDDSPRSPRWPPNLELGW